MELGKQIKRYRTERGISQEDLAANVYVARQTVSNWETDKTYPDVQSLLLLSVFFDVTIDELIKGDVEAMKEAVNNDWKKMNALSLGGAALGLLGAVLAIGGVSFWNWNIVPSVLLGLVVWGCGLGMILAVEHIKKKHDLVTYRELIAFSKGEPIDRDNPRSQKVRCSKVFKHRAARVTLSLIAGGIVGGIAGYWAYVFFG